MDELQKRYDVLFEMYVEHIHEHRLGIGKTCSDCIRLANEEIKHRLTMRAADGRVCTCDKPSSYEMVDGWFCGNCGMPARR